MPVLRGRLVGELAATAPDAIRAFRETGIDCCRDARISLEDASLRCGVRLSRLVALVLGAGARDRSDPDWRGAPLRSVTRHIAHTIHPALIASMERLSTALADAARAFPNDSSIGAVRSAFAEVANNLVIHVWRVENEVFPLLDRLEGVRGEGTSDLSPEDFPDPRDPMLEGLRRLRAMTRDYASGAESEPLEARLRELQDFDDHLHRHIHLEHHVLYPRAAALCACPLGGSEPAAVLTWL